MNGRTMTPREGMIHALERRPPIPGTKVPHFELVFFLTMESLGKVHPTHRGYAGWAPFWDSMSERERDLHRRDMCEVCIQAAERFGQNGFMVSGCPWDVHEELPRQLEMVREMSGDRFFLAAGLDPTFAIPDGNSMEEFAVRIAEDPEGLKAEAERRLQAEIGRMEGLARRGCVDALCLCADYCFNRGPFLSPAMFSEFVTPYLARFISACRDAGLYAIKHTDGNILPILDQLVQANPHALHSLDPQAGVDIADVKRRFGDRVALIGNVNCGLLQTGTDDEVVADCRYALRNGMPGGGYVYSTSNCVFPGMPLERYELMLSVRDQEGTYR